MRIEVIENREDLSKIGNLWTAFSQKHFHHLCNDYFWNVTALDNYFPGSAIKVFLFYDQEELIGILPLCLSKSTFTKLPVWKYHFFEQGIGLTTPLIKPSHLRECFETLRIKLAGYLPVFHVLKLTLNREQKEALSPFFKMANYHGFTVLFTTKTVLRLKIKSGLEFGEQVFTGHQHREFRRIEKRLRENFKLHNEQPEREKLITDFDRYWQRFILLYQKSWKHSSKRSLSNVASENIFFQTIFRGYAEREQLHVSFLQLDNSDVASDWRVLHRGVVYGLQIVFDENYRRYSPGRYLLYKDLFNLTEQGNFEFDYLGSQEFKKYVSNKSQSFHDVYILDNGVYGKILGHLAKFSGIPFRIVE